jgi:hypothetical protein
VASPSLRDKLNRPIAPNGRIGSWTIEVLCDSSGGSSGLSVYATKRRGTGNSNPNSDATEFVLDPIRNIPFDKNHPKSSLFGTDSKLCKGGGTVATQCPNGIKGINFDTQQVECAMLNVPPCPQYYFVTGAVNGVVSCGRP